MRRRVVLVWLMLFMLCSLAIASDQWGEYVGITDSRFGLDISVEDHRNIGSFSIGGLYNGNWEKLTFNYPRPWSGTFMTVNVDGKYYTTSEVAKDGVLMDRYNTLKPMADGQSVVSVWMLPEGIKASGKWSVAENKTIIEVKLANSGNISRNVGVRVQLDTLLGVNDGAPIYIPGSGLVTTESEYSGSSLNFEYWKAYNRPEEPTIVATGFIDSKDGMTYPGKIVVADWKQSKNTAWDYRADSGRSILGDSAVLLYYDLGEIAPGEEKTVVMGYGSGNPVLAEKKYWGVAELVLDRISGSYCPGEYATIKADILNSRDNTETGKVRITISSGSRVYYRQESSQRSFDKDRIESIAFNVSLPDEKGAVLDVKAELTDASGALIDSKGRKGLIRLDAGGCARPTENKGLLFLLSLTTILIIAAIILLAAYYMLKVQRTVKATRTINGEDVKIVIENKTGRDINECEVEESIQDQCEIDVITLNVLRKNDKLIWTIGKLEKDGHAILEYKIKDAEPKGRIIIRWDAGEKEYNS